MKKKLLAGVIATLVAASASAFEPFTVKDIRVDGIQRTEAGTVFSYLPIKVGDTMTDEKAAQAIKALFATGFFKDVRIEIDGGVKAENAGKLAEAGADILVAGSAVFGKEDRKAAIAALR